MPKSIHCLGSVVTKEHFVQGHSTYDSITYKVDKKPGSDTNFVTTPNLGEYVTGTDMDLSHAVSLPTVNQYQKYNIYLIVHNI